MQPEYPFLGPKYGLQVGAKNTILTELFVSASLATSRAGALERFHECLLSGASAEMRQDQVTHSRRMKSSSKQICAHAEETDTVPKKKGNQGVKLWFNWQDRAPDQSKWRKMVTIKLDPQVPGLQNFITWTTGVLTRQERVPPLQKEAAQVVADHGIHFVSDLSLRAGVNLDCRERSSR